MSEDPGRIMSQNTETHRRSGSPIGANQNTQMFKKNFVLLHLKSFELLKKQTQRFDVFTRRPTRSKSFCYPGSGVKLVNQRQKT